MEEDCPIGVVPLVKKLTLPHFLCLISMVAVFGPSQLHKEGLNIVHRGQCPGLPTAIEKREKKREREREDWRWK